MDYLLPLKRSFGIVIYLFFIDFEASHGETFWMYVVITFSHVTSVIYLIDIVTLKGHNLSL